MSYRLNPFQFALGIPGALLLAPALLIGEIPDASASLMGATVSLSLACCTSPADVFSNTVTGTVPVTFPSGSLYNVTTGGKAPVIWEATAGTVSATSEISFQSPSVTFYGQIWHFSGLSSPITNVTIDPLSSLPLTSVTFTGDTIFVNNEGVFITAGGEYILDVTTGGAAIPEPATIALFGIGLAGLTVFVRRTT